MAETQSGMGQMMPSVTVEISVEGTDATLGCAGNHTLDRARGQAGGLGLGFNGAELLALTIGCFANDLRYVAA